MCLCLLSGDESVYMRVYSEVYEQLRAVEQLQGSRHTGLHGTFAGQHII